MDKTEAIRKIKKLMRMADPKSGASAGEIQNALGMIDRMMMDNNLHQSQIMVDDEEVKVTESAEARLSTNRNWHKFLTVAIQRICEVQATIRGLHGGQWRAYTFIGTEDDVELAHEMFSEFVAVIQSNARRFYVGVVDQRSYCDGYASTLVHRAEEIVEARKKWTGTTAMIFVGKKSIAIKKRTESIPKAKPASISDKQTAAYYHGKKDGQSADLNKKKSAKKLEAVNG